MIKKLTLTLLASAILILLSVPTLGFADEKDEVIENGQLKNNRVLIPLRAVSQHMGAAVNWNQEHKIITINKDDTEILLAVNFTKVRVNQLNVDLDAPPELIKSTTYVPLRFVSQTLGAEVKWNQQVKQATIKLNGKKIVINMEQPSIKISASQTLTGARLKLLSNILNEANDVSSIKQIQTHFKPYFTENFIISSIIPNKGLKEKLYFEEHTGSTYYTSKTTASFTQSIVVGSDIYADGRELYVVDRLTKLIYTDGVWKVDNVRYSLRSGFPNIWI